MFSSRIPLIGCLAASLTFALPLMAHTPASLAAKAPRVIVVKLVEAPGSKVPFAFSPATFSARRGDTIRFVQQANTMHNVHFKTMPSGAKLGGAAMSPYLTTKGQAYTIVVDSRFTAGKYGIVCDPHEMLGMHATLTVTK